MSSRTALKSCACIIALMAAACTRVPELEDQLTPALKRADYPMLVPLESAAPPLPDPAIESTALEQELAARSARLQARAGALAASSN
ncbi:hypothetical protein [Parasedimentitalea huanghaiensis]|uniref:DUF3035 domain-containing protein n=1 Tax=Parasedimentitalea huanghaiensis TaxID=2682100 RepID=A0A6L6WEJ7_9RHOB|nr:hypothetical protein [Zongyanglinia huanghaiensis]MVO15698.1 hypothetical protein [Zongyanglinia huanghaiensis]